MMLPGHSVSTLYPLQNYQILSFEEVCIAGCGQITRTRPI